MMKKCIIVLVVLSVIIAPLTASAGSIWGLVKNSGMKPIPSNGYTISVKGVDIRAYVFEVKEMNSVCVSVWGNNTNQLECKTYAQINEETKKEGK